MLLFFCSIIYACNTVTPDKYFATATLNNNILFGFAGRGMQNELANPSEKLIDQKTMTTVPMTRAEVLGSKLEAIEANYKKVNSLSINGETKEMIEASLTLYEFVLPVYKNEYKQLAALYDNNAGADEIAVLEQLINEKYEAPFAALYDKALATGIAYAEKHGIEVHIVNPVPQGN